MNYRQYLLTSRKRNILKRYHYLPSLHGICSHSPLTRAEIFILVRMSYGRTRLRGLCSSTLAQRGTEVSATSCHYIVAVFCIDSRLDDKRSTIRDHSDTSFPPEAFQETLFQTTARRCFATRDESTTTFFCLMRCKIYSLVVIGWIRAEIICLALSFVAFSGGLNCVARHSRKSLGTTPWRELKRRRLWVLIFTRLF